jgi:hypothetical protein
MSNGARSGPEPATDCLRSNEQTSLAIARQHASERAEHNPVGERATRTGDLATEYRELVAQHQDLHLLPVVRSATQNEQLHEPPERPVDDGGDHPPIVPAATRTPPHRVSGTHTVPATAIRLAATVGGTCPRS